MGNVLCFVCAVERHKMNCTICYVVGHGHVFEIYFSRTDTGSVFRLVVASECDLSERVNYSIFKS